jgi:hypothetical protein
MVLALPLTPGMPVNIAEALSDARYPAGNCFAEAMAPRSPLIGCGLDALPAIFGRPRRVSRARMKLLTISASGKSRVCRRRWFAGRLAPVQ